MNDHSQMSGYLIQRARLLPLECDLAVCVQYLSLVVLLLLVVVEHSVTLATQVTTVVTQDQRLCLTVIMVITQRLGGDVCQCSMDGCFNPNLYDRPHLRL